ncbi:MAG TPA: SurA N-terminal domain-containing protein [bacterium]
MFRKSAIRRLFKSRPVIWAIIAALVIPFLLFFHSGQVSHDGPGGAAGTVFGDPVPWDTFLMHQDWVARWQPPSLPEDAPAEFAQQAVTRTTWERLVLLEEAKRSGIRVTDGELAAAIRELPDFRSGDRFWEDRYRALLQARGTTPRMFERMFRGSLEIRKLLNGVLDTVTLTDDEIRRAYADRHTSASIELAHLSASAFRGEAAAAVTGDDLLAYYDTHQEAFRIPERLSLKLAEVSRDALAEGAAVTDREIEDALGARADGETPPDRDAIRRQLEDRALRRKMVALAIAMEDGIEAGRTLEAVAQEHAIPVRDVGPAALAELFIIERLPAAVVEAAAELGAGGRPRLIETETFLVLLEVTDRQAPRLLPFEEAREDVRNRVIEERAVLAARRAAGGLKDAIAERLAAGAAFADAAREHPRSTLISPPPMTRQEPIPGLGQEPGLNAAAFELPPGVLSDPVPTSEGAALLIVRERTAPDEAQFEEDRDTFTDTLMAERREARLREWLEGVYERANVQSYVEDWLEGA